MDAAQREERRIQKNLGSRPKVTDPDKIALTTGQPACFRDSGIVLGQDAWQRTG
jgi:hypothetical protein